MSRYFKFILLGHDKAIEHYDILTYGEMNVMKTLIDNRYIPTATPLSDIDICYFRKKFYPDQEFLEYNKGWVFRKEDLLSIKEQVENDIKDLQNQENRIQKELIEKLETDIRTNNPDLNDTLDEVISNIRDGNIEYKEELEDLSYLIKTLDRIISFIDFYTDRYDSRFNYENSYDDVSVIVQGLY